MFAIAYQKYTIFQRIKHTAESNRLGALGIFCEFFVKKCCPLLTTLVSCSPIIQNGKPVGAVTHVLIGAPTAGYGIFIENRLNAAKQPLQKGITVNDKALLYAKRQCRTALPFCMIPSRYYS